MGKNQLVNPDGRSAVVYSHVFSFNKTEESLGREEAEDNVQVPYWSELLAYLTLELFKMFFQVSRFEFHRLR